MAPVELHPDRFAAGGEALARDSDGRVVFVRGALPGETVAVEITQHKRDWARGHVVDVIAPSTERVTPPCPSRLAGCGGCGWMHLDLPAQRRAKAAIVEESLRRTGGLRHPKTVVGPGVPDEGYRTTIRAAAGPGGIAGFRAERSHDVVPAAHCLISHPTLRRLLPTLRLDAGVDVTLRTSVATGEVGARWDRSSGEVRNLPLDVLRGGDATLHEDVAGKRLRVSLGSFFQSGPDAAALLVAAVRRAAPEIVDAAVVIDAYAGVGVFAVCATSPDTYVVAIETSRRAVADARENLAGRDHEVVCGEVGGWHAPAGLAVDVVVADPARSGLGGPGVAALVRLGAPVLVLVSCDPGSLGRDAKLLAGASYEHQCSELIDTFPQTTHIEVVSRFTRL